MMSYNIDDGYPEALCRAMRKGFLLDYHYAMLKQTSTIGEFRIVLEDTDYGADVFAGQEGQEFEVQVLRKTMKLKLMEQI